MRNFILFSLLQILFNAKLSAQDITTHQLTIPSNKYTLSGEMLLPKNMEEGQKLPVIIFVVGSNTSSYRTNYQSFWKYFSKILLLRIKPSWSILTREA